MLAATIAQKLQAAKDDPDSLELAKDAIDYVLNRVRDDENIRYHMGAFTEAFEKLKLAHSTINGISDEAIEAEIFGRELKRKPAAKKLDEIKKLIEEYTTGYDDKAELINKITAVID